MAINNVFINSTLNVNGRVYNAAYRDYFRAKDTDPKVRVGKRMLMQRK